MIPLFALTTRGLESLAARELSKHHGFKLLSTSYRRVVGEWQGDVCELMQLRTIDDLFFHLAEWKSITHMRDMLPRFELLSSQLVAGPALAACSEVRTIPSEPQFSISASFVGKRNYSSDEIKSACSDGFSRASGWCYTPDDRQAHLNLRIFIEHETASAGIRLSGRPLHERSYKQHQIPGSLKPPVAAALLEMLEISPGSLVVDPCCGAGTILIEALASGAKVRGGDINTEAVRAALSNGGAPLTVEEWDARRLPLSDKSVNYVATNLPWDRQIQLDQDRALFHHNVCSEIERILIPGGRAAILTSMPELLQFKSLKQISQTEISLFGQKPVIALYQA